MLQVHFFKASLPNGKVIEDNERAGLVIDYIKSNKNIPDLSLLANMKLAFVDEYTDTGMKFRGVSEIFKKIGVNSLDYFVFAMKEPPYKNKMPNKKNAGLVDDELTNYLNDLLFEFIRGKNPKNEDQLQRLYEIIK